jgi:hypothetical protein
MTRAALAYLRKWWPELLCAALLILIGSLGQKDDPLFSVFVAIVLAIGWGMCARHKRMPLHDKLDKVGQDVEQVRDIIIAATTEPDDGQPAAPVLQLFPTGPSSPRPRYGNRDRA